jgi:hypothetical protein
MALLTYAVENAKLKGDQSSMKALKEVTEQIEQSILKIAL